MTEQEIINLAKQAADAVNLNIPTPSSTKALVHIAEFKGIDVSDWSGVDSTLFTSAYRVRVMERRKEWLS